MPAAASDAVMTTRVVLRIVASVSDYMSAGARADTFVSLAKASHAIELALKGFVKQCEMQGSTLGKLPSNHDLQAWYDLAVKHGLEDHSRIAQNLTHLTDLHFTAFARYPQDRSIAVPDLSTITDETVEFLIETITQTVNPRS